MSALFMVASILGASNFWAGHQVVYSQVHVPLLGERSVRSDAWVLAEVHEQGGQLRWSERPCRLVMGKVAGVQTSMPAATLPMLPATEVSLTRNTDDTYAGTWSAQWPDADLDEDGQRGISLDIDVPLCSGRVYVAMHSVTHAQARRFGDELLGEMQTDVAQQVLGASNPCLLLGGRRSMQAQQGVFRYMPVDAHSCEQVKAWPLAADQ